MKVLKVEEYFVYPQGVCRIRKPACAGNGCAIFPTFNTAQLGKKIRCSAEDDLFRASLSILCMTKARMCILNAVMFMKNSREILTSVLKTTQMGQIGIRSVLDTSMRPGLRKALESQLREYDSIETEAHSIATQRGWDMDELDPSVRLWSNLMTRMKLNGRNTDSKIADMMIQGNTKGMIKGLKTLHQFGQQDEQINTLSQKLLDCENANIRQMQGYL